MCVGPVLGRRPRPSLEGGPLIPGPTASHVARLARDGHGLLLVTGPPRTSVDTLDGVARLLGTRRSNVGAALAEVARASPPRLRPTGVERTLTLTLGPGPLVLDHVEALFEPSLELRPLGVLLKLARTRPVVARWPGAVDAGDLVYAVPGHPEHVRMPIGGAAVVDVGGS